MEKTPKFFCENCNQEVRRDALVCPHCGRFFASVRCPKCHYTGTHKDFKDGCPNCGYSLTSPSKKQKETASVSPTVRNTDSRNDDALPSWVYRLVVSLTIFALILFVTLMFKK